MSPFPLFFSTFWSNRFCSLVQTTAITISTLLCLARYSLLASMLHPAKRSWTLSLSLSHCSLHNLHWLFSESFLTSFQALVSTICYNTDIMANVFLGVKFWSSHILHFLSCFLYIAVCISFFLYCLSVFFLTTFFEAFFYLFPYTNIPHKEGIEAVKQKLRKSKPGISIKES